MTLENLTIVAIDDTASIRTFLRVSLMDEGAMFYEASTAQTGVDMCREKKPNLVILDLGLPDADGLDILPRIKHELNPENPPIVLVLTVRKERDVVAEAYRRGADAYLSKPFMVEDLFEVLEDKLD